MSSIQNQNSHNRKPQPHYGNISTTTMPALWEKGKLLRTARCGLMNRVWGVGIAMTDSMLINALKYLVEEAQQGSFWLKRKDKVRVKLLLLESRSPEMSSC